MSRGEAGKPTWYPAIEVSERDGSYQVRAEFSGINPNEVKRRFYRTLPLPENADAEKARARFEDGVLEITVPLRAEQRNKSREIPIETPPASPAAAGDSVKAA